MSLVLRHTAAPKWRSILVMTLLLFAVAAMPFAHARADSAAVTEYVNKIGNDALTVMSGPDSKQAKISKLEDMFRQVVDIEWISRFVLGRYNRQITPEQREKYLSNYSGFLIKYYVSNFEDYKEGTTFKVTGTSEDKPGEFVSSMQILRPGAKPLVVSYRVREDGSSYKVVDIVVEGVSLIITQRSEFSSVISRDGIDGLIALLEKKKSQGQEIEHSAAE